MVVGVIIRANFGMKMRVYASEYVRAWTAFDCRNPRCPMCECRCRAIIGMGRKSVVKEA